MSGIQRTFREMGDGTTEEWADDGGDVVLGKMVSPADENFITVTSFGKKTYRPIFVSAMDISGVPNPLAIDGDINAQILASYAKEYGKTTSKFIGVKMLKCELKRLFKKYPKIPRDVRKDFYI